MLFEINMGTLCNFRCKYCFENGEDCNYKPTVVTKEVIDNFIKYMRYIKYSKKYRGIDINLLLYGGEPMMQFEKIKYLVKQTKGVVEDYSITTNGSLTEKYREDLLRLQALTNNRVGVNSSYDFTMQDEMRHVGSYETVRDSIRWLYKNNFGTKCITVFSMRNFSRIDEIFFDFVKLHKECPTLELTFNIDRYGEIPEDFDDIEIRKSLQKVKDYIDNNPHMKNYFRFNIDPGEHKTNKPFYGCFYEAVFVGMTSNGDLWPSYEFEDMTKFREKKDLLYLGNVFEHPSVIEERRDRIIKELCKYEHPKECLTCKLPCRGHPWTFITDNYESWYRIPSKGYCRIQRTIWEYIK